MAEFNSHEEKYIEVGEPVHFDIKSRKPSKREQYEMIIEELKKLPTNSTILNTITFLENNKPKPYESRKKVDCICGEKGRNIVVWWNLKDNYWFCQCPNCDIKAEGNKKYIQAIRNWNNMIEDLSRQKQALQ